MAEARSFEAALDRAELLRPLPRLRLWRMTSRFILRPGEFAEEGVTPEWAALALPLRSHRLSSALSSRGSVPDEMAPAFMASDEQTARAEFMKRWPATRFKVWSLEIQFAACLDLTENRIESSVDPSGSLGNDRDSWIPLFRAAWERDIEVIRFRSFAARARGGICYAVLQLRPGSYFSEPHLESQS